MRGITPDQVEVGLREEQANIDKSLARQLAWIQIADAMQLPTADGAKSMKEWVGGRLDVSPETASRLSATARRLTDSPEVARRLAEGDITFDRAEATSRIPLDHQRESLKGIDIQGLRRLAAKHKRLRACDDHHSHVSQHLNIQPNLDESRWDIWGELDGYGGAVISKVLTEEADRLPDLPDGERMGVGYRRAVALANICEGAASESAAAPLITVFLDKSGAEIETGPRVGPGIVDRIACSGALDIIKSVEGTPLGVGRKTKVVSNRLKRFVLHRDGGCTADGCTSRYRLEPHHKIPWSEGGPTEPENLTTLCWFHHHIIVHGRGYRIDFRLGPGRIRFIHPGHDPP